MTHDQEEALSLADRLVVLRDGRVQQIGTPEELHTHPANWHVADFMGYRNLLDLTVDSVSGSDGSSVRARPVADRHRRHEVRAATPCASAIRPHDLIVVDPGQSVQGRTLSRATSRWWSTRAASSRSEATHLDRAEPVRHRRAAPLAGRSGHSRRRSGQGAGLPG